MEAPQIRSLVDRFVADLATVIRQEALEAVRGALGDATAPARRGPVRSEKTATRAPRKKAGRRKKATSRKGGRRSPEGVAALGETVLAHVRANPGQRLEEIGRELGMPTKELKRPIPNLMEAGELRTEGQKRGTKYFAGGRAKKGSLARKK